jgi:hypothetical protein
MSKVTKITSLEEKPTSTGKQMMCLTLEDGRKPSMFAGHSYYNSFKVGDTIKEEDLLQNGNYWNVKDPNRKAGGKGDMGKMMQAKQEGIALSQKNKEKGIMLSSTIRMAVDLVVAEGMEGDVKQRIQTWRSWLIAEWDNDDITNSEPF